LLMSLNGEGEANVLARIKELKQQFRELEPWYKGMPKRCNNLTMYTAKVSERAKVPENYRLHKLEAVKNEGKNNMVPGHVSKY